MIERLRARQEWQFFAALPRADARLTVAWWVLLLLNGDHARRLRGGDRGRGGRRRKRADSLTRPLTFVGVVFVLMLVVSPMQTAVSMNLGNKLSAWLNEAPDPQLCRSAGHRPSRGSPTWPTT